MMNSLFSSFDPITSMFQMNWITLFSPMIILPMTYWIKKSRINLMKTKLETFMVTELKNITHHKEFLLFSSSTFTSILIMNIMGLMPYIYTPTSHIAISTSLALPLWTLLMIYGWINFFNSMMSHMLPKGTPVAIMPMMIIIEFTGNLIRPISLSVRLTANMIAGHLVMTLLGDMNDLNLIWMVLPLQTMMMMFESAISMIQAYVFSTLATLYSSEIPYG